MPFAQLSVDLTVKVRDFLRGFEDAGNAAVREASRISQANEKAQREADALIRRVGVSAGQTAAAMRTLPAQFTDIATQLQGGANPLTILLQQGGQIKDSFGGIGPALAALGTFITPVAVAVTGLVTAVGAFAVAAFQGQAEAEKLAKAIQLSGNFAGVTVGQFDQMARRVGESTKAGTSAAREALEALVSNGDVGPRLFRPMGEAAAAFAKVSGESAGKVAADFAKMSDGVAKWAADFNRSHNFITAAQYERIRSLEESGQKEQAALITLGLLNDRLDTMAGRMGYWAQRWHELGDAASSAWEAMKGIGAPETIENQLSGVNAQLAEMDRIAKTRRGLPAFSSAPDGPGGQSRANLEAERGRLLVDQDGQQVAAAMGAAAAATQKAGIAASDYLKKLHDQARGQGAVNDKLEEYRQKVAAAAAAGIQISAAQQAADEAQIRKQFAGPKDSAASKAATLAKQQEDAYVRLSLAIREKLSLDDYELTTGNKISAIEKERLDAIRALESATVKLLPAKQAEIVADINRHARNQQEIADMISLRAAKETDAAAARAVLDSLTQATEARRNENLSIRDQIAAIGLNAREIENLSIKRLEAARDGQQAELDEAKLYGADSATLMGMRAKVRELEKQIELRRQLADTTTQQESDPNAGVSRAVKEYNDEIARRGDDAFRRLRTGIGGLEDRFSEFFVKGKADWRGYFEAIAIEQARVKFVQPLVKAGLDYFGSAVGSFFGGGRASGGDVRAGMLYEVNERSGPGELLVSGSKTYLMAKQNGRVVPQSGGSTSTAGGGVVNHFSIDARGADAGVEARIQQGVRQAVSQSIAAVQATANRGGNFAKAVGRR